MHFRFESPWLLLLLILLPVLAAWLLLNKSWTKEASMRYSAIRLPASVRPSLRYYLRFSLTGMRFLILALIILASARPQIGISREVVEGEGVDITLALDISGSMASLDFEPDNRLEAAKRVIGEFVKSRPNDHIGLVVFAGNAFHQCPPTGDHTFLLRILDQVELATDLGIEDNTALGMGLANAANMLKNSPAASKIIILLTDGVNNSGQIDPLTAAKAAKAVGIQIYTIGMGEPGEVPVPITDPSGSLRTIQQPSELDEETLKQIAEITDGKYYRAQDEVGLKQGYDEINLLEKSTFEVTSYNRYREAAGWMLLPAVLLMLLEKTLSETLFRRLP